MRDKGKTWHDMCEFEQRDIGFAAVTGKVIQRYSPSDGWTDWDGLQPLSDCYDNIRIKPETETVTLYVGHSDPDCDPRPIGTIDLVNGRPEMWTIRLSPSEFDE